MGDDEELQDKLRKLQSSRAGREKLRERTSVEHSLAHLSNRQGPRARYLGTRKNTFDLRRHAARLCRLQTEGHRDPTMAGQPWAGFLPARSSNRLTVPWSVGFASVGGAGERESKNVAAAFLRAALRRSRAASRMALRREKSMRITDIPT